MELQIGHVLHAASSIVQSKYSRPAVGIYKILPAFGSINRPSRGPFFTLNYPTCSKATHSTYSRLLIYIQLVRNTSKSA
jgi:hypothetical protein